MSEERDKRDDRSEDPSTSASDSAGASGSAGAPDSAKPTGKRTTRRARAAGSSAGDSSTERVSITKSPSQTSVTGVSSARSSVSTRSDSTREPKRMNIFKRLRKFLREVVAELRKVIWPNRKQMITYTSVVLVFVTFMVAFISGLDLAFIRGVSWLFG